MSRQFVKFSVNYFLGTTGVAIREAGGDNAVVVGAYLLAKVDYLGLQRMHLQDVADDLGKELTEVEAAIDVFERVGFARYDRINRVLWIVNGAKYALGVPDDRSTLLKKAAREFADIPRKSPFRREFHAMYSANLQLEPLEQEVVENPVASTSLIQVAAPIAEPVPAPAPVEAPAPIAAMTQPPTPVVAPGLTPDPAAIAQRIGRTIADEGRGQHTFSRLVRMLLELREALRVVFPADGDEEVKYAAGRINKACGSSRAIDYLAMAMKSLDLDLKEALAMVFPDEHQDADV